MEEVCVCNNCGRTIEKQFIYCPWCGIQKGSLDAIKALDEAFDRIEEMQRNRQLSLLEELKAKIREIEKDLGML